MPNLGLCNATRKVLRSCSDAVGSSGAGGRQGVSSVRAPGGVATAGKERATVTLPQGVALLEKEAAALPLVAALTEGAVVGK